jgi:hypothetical protein
MATKNKRKAAVTVDDDAKTLQSFALDIADSLSLIAMAATSDPPEPPADPAPSVAQGSASSVATITAPVKSYVLKLTAASRDEDIKKLHSGGKRNEMVYVPLELVANAQKLLENLATIRSHFSSKFGSEVTMQVVSGYRTKEANASKEQGRARDSQHTLAKACDFKLFVRVDDGPKQGEGPASQAQFEMRTFAVRGSTSVRQINPVFVAEQLALMMRDGQITPGGYNAYDKEGYTHYDIRGNTVTW